MDWTVLIVPLYQAIEINQTIKIGSDYPNYTHQNILNA